MFLFLFFFFLFFFCSLFSCFNLMYESFKEATKPNRTKQNKTFSATQNQWRRLMRLFLLFLFCFSKRLEVVYHFLAFKHKIFFLLFFGFYFYTNLGKWQLKQEETTNKQINKQQPTNKPATSLLFAIQLFALLPLPFLCHCLNKEACWLIYMPRLIGTICLSFSFSSSKIWQKKKRK